MFNTALLSTVHENECDPLSASKCKAFAKSQRGWWVGVSTVEETRTEAQAQQQRQTHTFQGKGASKAFRTGAKASE